MPTGSSHINATLAGLCAAGGVMGYVKARSMPSVSATLAHSLVCMPCDAVHIYKANLQTAASLCLDTLFQWTHHFS